MNKYENIEIKADNQLTEAEYKLVQEPIQVYSNIPRRTWWKNFKWFCYFAWFRRLHPDEIALIEFEVWEGFAIELEEKGKELLKAMNGIYADTIKPRESMPTIRMLEILIYNNTNGRTHPSKILVPEETYLRAISELSPGIFESTVVQDEHFLLYATKIVKSDIFEIQVVM